MKEKRIAHFSAVALMLVWGMSYLSIKIVVEEIEPTLSAFYRFFLASVILFVIMKVKYPQEKIIKEDRVMIALGGFFGIALYFFFENFSVLYTSASNVAILISSIPVFTIVSQRIIFKERLSVWKTAGVLFSAVGIVIIIASKGKVSLFSSGTKGDLMAIGAALSWVLYNVVVSKLKGSYKSITITTYQGIWGCIFLSPCLLWAKVEMPSTKVTLNIIFLAIICSIVGTMIYIYCLEKLGATVITTYINLQPIVSLIGARIILKEQVAIVQVLGSFIIIAGVFLVSFGERFSKKKFEELL